MVLIALSASACAGPSPRADVGLDVSPRQVSPSLSLGRGGANVGLSRHGVSLGVPHARVRIRP